ncbi:MAG: hypothetical protein DME25_15920 [Verrucomicrobia bacterium]|nr:MAG: hypothetical protein DME25_15920 [Verrucomicrobiota bacterium]
MNSREDSTLTGGGNGDPALTGRRRESRPGCLHLVTERELQELRDALAAGTPPADLEAKLSRLHDDSLIHRFVRQNSRLIIELLLAAYHGTFREASPATLERLLRVLAYVRKEVDAIPDYLPDGLVDDQREIRAVLAELGQLFASFKAWRLRFQVPGMWK